MNSIQENNLLLMCKDISVYDISNQTILNEKLVPGAILRGTMSFDEWMETRYSAHSNPSARRLMLRAFSTDKHNGEILKTTRALSLSDCYWIKQQGENVLFNNITPYLNKEWDGFGVFTGGSISTLFTNGAANKTWLDKKTLLKTGSPGEIDAYTLCKELSIDTAYYSEARISDEGLLLTNFTSTDRFLESAGQSGLMESDKPHADAVRIFKERAVTLLTIDYLVEHDDRHQGNYGFLRNSDTGEYEGMAPYYDFDWIWTSAVVRLPDKAFADHGALIKELCIKAKDVAGKFEKGEIIIKRADELLEQAEKINASDEN
jgi:hypothetical protein